MSAPPTGVLFNDGRAKPLSVVGQIQPGAYYQFYLTGTLTLTPVYADGLLATPLSQTPGTGGTTAASDGRLVPMYLNPATTYRYQLYSSTNVLLADVDPYIPAPLPTGDQIGSQIFPQSALEIANGVTPVHMQYPVGDIRRYGALFNGSDETAVVSNWLAVTGTLTFPVPSTIIISSQCTVKSNTRITAVPGAVIQSNTPNINFLVASQQADIWVDGLTFKLTNAGTAQVAGISFDRITRPIIRNCEFIGMQFYGIWTPGAQSGLIDNNYFHSNQNLVGQDTADIDLSSPTTPTRFTTVSNNTCSGGGEFGIACWDQYGNVIPTRNLIIGNKVNGGNTGYGILFYLPDAGDSFNQCIGNTIQDVQGSIVSNPSSGAGIYVVGLGAGGTLIQGNIITNCCINTGNESLAPAGIGVNGSAAGSAPMLIQGNVISNMTQYHGIYVSDCLGGVSVTGNTVNMPAANSTGAGIKVANSAGVTVTANTVGLVTSTNPNAGILLEANTASNNNITVSNNTVTGGHSSQIRTVQVGGSLNSGIVISGNQLTGGDASCIPLTFDTASAGNVLVANNNIRATTQPAIQQPGCTFIRYVGNFINSTGSVTLAFTGTNSSSFFDRSNIGFPITGAVSNAGTGLIIEQLGSNVPSAGTWAIGDTIRNTGPVATGVYEWICTTAGTPGTFKTISNT